MGSRNRPLRSNKNPTPLGVDGGKSDFYLLLSSDEVALLPLALPELCQEKPATAKGLNMIQSFIPLHETVQVSI